MDSSSLYEVSEIHLTYKNHCKASERLHVATSNAAYQLLMNAWDDNKLDFVEQAKAVLLNRGNHVLGLYEISSGGISGTLVDPRLVFVAELKANASGIILAHNHPSGNLKPSEHDKRLTEKFKAASYFLDINLMDHLIVSREGYYSFTDDETYKIDQSPSSISF